ncbi:molybdopterin-dependent oxidoreductase [Streptomyces sp. A7024]|uniref:Molybdopterin-dependent oxidoreductase n=1 Tax=Streptomyces coryli TaxID=1128680 RepID=A0A6G4U0C3_9ACTN|nr:molybdopterin-dependent oxidoreductase [Streptomyces coryli]NGN65533.1 molybdopterin-dependent oxidoreductase [Streptomyces coryli]
MNGNKRGFWRSPLRGPWFTSVLGLVLLIGLPVLFVTGLLSYAAYNPDLGRGNDHTPDRGILGFFLFPWPTSPHWLYRVTQGIHVIGGFVLIPVVLAKLWSVFPRLFQWPPVRSLTHALERGSLLLLVGATLFELVTGVLNTQLDYLFPGSFYRVHYYGAWVFFAALVVHVALRLGKLRRGLRDEGGEELRAPDPAPSTISRRGAVALVGAGSLTLFAVTAGQVTGGPLRRTALLAPHGGADPGPEQNGFQVNKTAAGRGIRAADTGEHWRLRLRGPGGDLALSRAELLELEQHTVRLPIDCVEGWSTGDQTWTGVRLKDLAALAGAEPDHMYVESLQRAGAFRQVWLRANQVRDGRSLLALGVNGAPLSKDHGFPARIVVPNNPGVHQTKWVERLTIGRPV